MLDDIQLKTNRGLDVGTDSFINKLEKLLNRSLKCAKQGWPGKKYVKSGPFKKTGYRSEWKAISGQIRSYGKSTG